MHSSSVHPHWGMVQLASRPIFGLEGVPGAQTSGRRSTSTTMIVNFEPIGCHANNALNLGVVLSGIEHKAQISWCFCSALVYLVGFIVREMHRGVTRHINVCVLVMVL